MATDCQKVLIPPAAASPKRPRLNLLIPKLPSSSVSRTPLRSPSPPYNAGSAQCSDTKMPQNGVMEIPNDDESDKSDKFSLGSLWKQSWHEYKCSYEQLKSKSSTGTGTNVATAHATSGGSRLSQPLRAGRLHCGDVGGTKMPPKDVIVISSDDESSDSETYDNESYDDASDDDESSDDGSSNDGSSDDGSSDDESSDEQQKSGPGCPLASSLSRTAPSTKLSGLANGALATCQPGQASAPNHTTRNNTAPATVAASLVGHKAARPDHGRRRDSQLFAELCGMTSDDDDSKCLSHDERDRRRFCHHVQGPRRVACSQEETRQKSDGRYRSASHDHHGDGDQTSGSAHRHPPVPDETGEPTENDPIRLPQVQERRASLSVLPDNQSISEPEPEDAELRSQYRSSPSAASKRGGETQHSSGSSALSQPRDHHGDRNPTNDLKQGDARLPGDRGEQGAGSSVVASPVQEGGASIPLSSAAMSNNDRVLADVGPSARPSASQDPVGLQQSLGRRPRSGTDVGENQRPAEDSIGEHGRGDVTQPPRKRRRMSTSTPAVGETAHKRQANLRRASSRSQRAQRPTIHHATPQRSQRRNPKPHSSGVASTPEQAPEKSRSVEQILKLRARYLVKWKGYGPEHNSWEPDEHFHRCPELLDQFHQTGPVTTESPSPSQLEIPKPHSAGGASRAKEAQREYFDVENILDCEVWYLVKCAGYKRSGWVPAEQLDQCPELLLQFHKRTGSVKELITRRIAAQMEARRSAA